MSLSWGQHPPEPLPPPTSHKRRNVAVAAFLVVAVGAAVFAATRPPAVDPTRSAIAALMEERHKAIAAKDLNGFLATIDPERTSLRLCEQQRFETVAALGIRAPDLSLGPTNAYGAYVRAWAHDLLGWKRFFARNVAGRWYVSEPVADEVGGDVSRAFSGISVVASEADSDLIDVVGQELGNVREAVTLYAPTTPTTLFKVRIATLATGSRCFIAGNAQAGTDGAVLTLRDVTVATAGIRSLSVSTSNTLMHEALHWIQIDHAAGSKPASIDWWLIEGWPERIANDPSGPARVHAVCSQPLPDYQDMAAPLLSAITPEETARRYVIAAVLIERLEVTYGAAAYWKLFDAFANEVVRDRAYNAAIATTGAAFYDAWAADARLHYC